MILRLPLKMQKCLQIILAPLFIFSCWFWAALFGPRAQRPFTPMFLLSPQSTPERRESAGTVFPSAEHTGQAEFLHTPQGNERRSSQYLRGRPWEARGNPWVGVCHHGCSQAMSLKARTQLPGRGLAPGTHSVSLKPWDWFNWGHFLSSTFQCTESFLGS